MYTPSEDRTCTEGTPHCDHVLGWDNPIEATIENRQEKYGAIYYQCCWCGRKRIETHGKFMKMH